MFISPKPKERIIFRQQKDIRKSGKFLLGKSTGRTIKN
jgi:hypothetical protein